MGVNKTKVLLSAAILSLGLSTLYLGLTRRSLRPTNDPNSWDILIFTQSWPNTLCYTWKGQNAHHTCNFPSEKNLWTIHGIWPTKLGTIGPQFCNKSVIFDPTSINSIKEKLNEYWTDIEIPPKNITDVNSSSIITSHKKESLWNHEWEKHGSCAMSLPTLDSEFKYFYQGIEWSEKYNMKNILEKSGIELNSTLYVTDYWKAVKSVLKTNAWVECIFKHDTKEQMLLEIRICFDKTFKLIDCDGIEKAERVTHSLTNCDMKKPILYLDYVPEHATSMNSNSNDDEDQKMLFRSKRKAVDITNEWMTKSHHRHHNRSNSHQFHVKPPINQDLSRSNSFPFIDRTAWDILIFSQAWPYTFCHTWTVNSHTHTCNLPANRNQWTIHGIWPSKIGTFGPFFCNNHTSFSIHALDSVNQELHNRWTEVKGSKTWTSKQEGQLWRHEYVKHGSCAKSLPALDTELKYFKQGLAWSKKYPLSEILSQGGIMPNGTYTVNRFWQTLTTKLGKTPRIDCFMEKNSNKAYIDEVRLCFDKTLALVDCDTFRKNKNRPYTNCPLNQEIYYLGAIVH